MSWKPAKAQVAKVGKQMGCHLCLVTVVGCWPLKNGRIFWGGGVWKDCWLSYLYKNPFVTRGFELYIQSTHQWFEGAFFTLTGPLGF